MSYCETDPERLQKLNDEVKSKPNRPLGFYPTPLALLDEYFASKFSPKDPYHSGNLSKNTYGFQVRGILIAINLVEISSDDLFSQQICILEQRGVLTCIHSDPSFVKSWNAII